MTYLPGASSGLRQYAGLFDVSHFAPAWVDLLAHDDWIQRRREQISFVSSDVIERRVRVDFCFPPAARLDGTEGLYALPLFMQSKRETSWDFELTDERGCELAWPARPQSAKLGAALLLCRAAESLDDDLPVEVTETLRRLALAPDANWAEDALRRALQPADERVQAWLKLGADGEFRALAEHLASAWLAVIVLSSRSRAPTVAQLRYRQQLALRRAGGISSVLGVLGWRDHELRLDVMQPLAADHRFELNAPAGVELLDVVVSSQSEGSDLQDVYADGPAPEVSLELPQQPRPHAVVVSARVRPTRTVVARVLTIAAIATAAIAAAAIWAGEIRSGRSAAPALVLLATTISVLGLVLLPSPHALVERLVAPIRALLLVIGAACAAATARVAVIPPGSSLAAFELFLILAAAVAGLALGLLIVTRPQRLGPTTLATPRSPALPEPEAGLPAAPRSPERSAEPRADD